MTRSLRLGLKAAGMQKDVLDKAILYVAALEKGGSFPVMQQIHLVEAVKEFIKHDRDSSRKSYAVQV